MKHVIQLQILNFMIIDSISFALLENPWFLWYALDFELWWFIPYIFQILSILSGFSSIILCSIPGETF